MYFMCGQPTETHEDIEGIVTLAKQGARDRAQAPRRARARARQHIELHPEGAHAVPVGVAGAAGRAARSATCYLRDALKKAGVQFTWEDPEHSLLEAVLSRGDRRLGKAIHRAWQAGARFDAWHEHYDWPRWEQALDDAGLDPAFFAYREPGLWDPFPWSHINIGVTESYLRARVAEDAEERADGRLPQGAVQRLRRAEPERRPTASTASTCVSPRRASRRWTAPASSGRSRCSR